MYGNKSKAADIAGERGNTSAGAVTSRSAGQCCPFLNNVRFYKTQSLKDEKAYFYGDGEYVEKKQKSSNKIDANAGTSMMYYL